MAPSYNSAIAFERSKRGGGFKYVHDACELKVFASAKVTAFKVAPPSMNSPIDFKRNKAL